MKILALEKDLPGIAREQIAPHLRPEAQRVWELYQQGYIREIYFRQDHPQAVLVLECRDVVEAENLLATLPLVHHGIISFDIIPLVPYPGFNRLFS